MLLQLGLLSISLFSYLVASSRQPIASLMMMMMMMMMVMMMKKTADNNYYHYDYAAAAAGSTTATAAQTTPTSPATTIAIAPLLSTVSAKLFILNPEHHPDPSRKAPRPGARRR